MNRLNERKNKRIVIQFFSAPSDGKLARKVATFIQQRGALFIPYNLEVSNYVIDSIKEIRTFLT